MAQKVFNTDDVLKGVIPVGDDECRFNYRDLENAVQALVERKLGDKGVTMAAASDVAVLPTSDTRSHHKACRTFVVATRALVANGPPELFRSYGPDAATCTIWEAARATSAAPSFFKPIRIHDAVDGTDEYFVDGGVAHNNPSEVALTEARSIWTNVKRFCLVSIGTGRQKTIKFVQIEGSDIPISEITEDKSPSNPSRFSRFLSENPLSKAVRKTYRTPAGIKALMEIVNACVELCNNAERVHERIFKSAHSVDFNSQFPYHRFDVDRDMDKMSLEEWRRMPEMIALTRTYLLQGETQKNVGQCVKYLLNPPDVECK